MGIKEKRQQRRNELFDQFVSVQKLIDYLAEKELLGIDEIAAELETAFVRNPDKSNSPAYGYVDEPSISFVPYSDHDAAGHLSGILSDTVMSGIHGDTADHHGWLRDELFPFLQGNGIDTPVDLTEWTPQDSPHSVADNQDLSSNTASENAIDYQSNGRFGIKGKTFTAFLLVLRDFPVEYPRYKEKLPSAKEVDIWIKGKRYFRSARHSLVFSAMALEHFSAGS